MTNVFPVPMAQYPTSGAWVATNQQDHQVLCTAPALPTTAMISTHHTASLAHVLKLPPTTDLFDSLPIPQFKPASVNPDIMKLLHFLTLTEFNLAMLHGNVNWHLRSKAFTMPMKNPLAMQTISWAWLKYSLHWWYPQYKNLQKYDFNLFHQ